MRKPIRFFLALILLGSAAVAEAKRPITFDDLAKLERISEPAVSPDGRWVAYVRGVVDMEANRTLRKIWLVPTAGGEPRQLTRGEGSDSRPQWSPDGQTLAFISTRGGKSQVWLIPVTGGEAYPLTSLSTEADGVIWSRRSDMLLFTSRVFPDCADDECNRKRLEEREKSPVKARLIDRLLYRHWDHWREDRYTHLFAVSAEDGTPRDLTPGAYDSPTWFLGAADAYAISPDGTEAVFSSNRTGRAAWSTNDDLYLVPAAGGEAKNITRDNPGSDAAPQYSPDGRYIAYTSQAREGYESDLVRLFVYDRKSGERTHVNPGYDNWVSSFAWAPDSDTIYFTAPERGRHPIYRTTVSKRKVEKVLDGYFDEVSVLPGPSGLVFTQTSLRRPADLYRFTFTPGSTPMQLTQGNDALMAELDLNPVEDVTTKGVRGDEMHSLLLKPPAFNPSAKYPAVVLIHGGPQSNWADAWSYRWNAQLFAARGYVVLMPNPPGSTGYGQAYVERISGDYGGDHYQDLMRAVDWLEAQPYVAKDQIGAAGASFGGYMVNWIAGQTARFKALVSHAGLFDLRSKYGETEELWFPEWDNRGTPWENPELYRKFSPSFYADKIQTPMLIVHGEHDYRVPYGQGLQIFTALQRRGVKSRLLFFPDEGHWILKPQNSRLWYETVLGWLDEHLK